MNCALAQKKKRYFALFFSRIKKLRIFAIFNALLSLTLYNEVTITAPLSEVEPEYTQRLLPNTY